MNEFQKVELLRKCTQMPPKATHFSPICDLTNVYVWKLNIHWNAKHFVNECTKKEKYCWTKIFFTKKPQILYFSFNTKNARQWTNEFHKISNVDKGLKFNPFCQFAESNEYMKKEGILFFYKKTPSHFLDKQKSAET